MYRVYCNVCGKSVGFYGWPSHVRKHKNELGEDIFDRLRRRREGSPDPDYSTVRALFPTRQVFLDDYLGGERVNRFVIYLLKREYHKVRREDPQITDREISREWGISQRQLYRYKRKF